MGDFLYVDLNEDGILIEKDSAPIKYSDYSSYYIWIFRFRDWKNFDFSFLFSGIAKASRLYAGWGATEFANVGFFSDYHLQAWTPERFPTGKKFCILHWGQLQELVKNRMTSLLWIVLFCV